MIAWLMTLVAPNVNRVGPYLFFVPQLLVATALLILYDLILWAVDKNLLRRPPQTRTSLPSLVLDYMVFFEVTGWIGSLGRHPWGLLIAVPPSLMVFVLVRTLPPVIATHRESSGAGWRHAWRTVLGPGGRVLFVTVIVTAALWLTLGIMMTVNPE
jgi:hypothetical protein